MWPDFSELTVLEDLRYSASWLHRQSTKKNPKSGFSQHGFDSGNSEWTRPTMTSVCRMLHPLHVNQRCVRSFTALQTTNFKQIPLSQKKKPVQWFSCFVCFFFYWKRWFLSSFFPTVVAGRAKPQQPSQQSGGTALSGKQEGVREEGDGHRGAELGGRLSFSSSLSTPSSPSPPLLHHPSTSVAHFYLIKKKNSNYIRRTQVPPWKNGRIKQPNQNGH